MSRTLLGERTAYAWLNEALNRNETEGPVSEYRHRPFCLSVLIGQKMKWTVTLGITTASVFESWYDSRMMFGMM